jgi:hypothetical protein
MCKDEGNLVMSMMNFLMVKLHTRLGFRSIAVWGLGASLLVVAPAHANEYQSCTGKLTDAKLDRTSTSKGCAEALHPDEVGSCVVRIVNDKSVANKITNTAALDACRRVRRPIELATCVTDIHGSSEATPVDAAGSIAVLDACRKSLLPQRYGQCVIGLYRDPLKMTVAEGLNTCLDATDYRKDIQLIPLSDVMGPASSGSTPVYTPPVYTPPVPTPAPAGQGLPQRL